MKIFEKIKNRNRRNQEIEMIEQNPLNRNLEVNLTNSTDMITYNFGYEGHNSSSSLGIGPILIEHFVLTIVRL